MTSPAQRIVACACLAIALFSLWNAWQFWRSSATLTQPSDPWGIAARHDRYAAMAAKLDAMNVPRARSIDFITTEPDPTTRSLLYFDAAYQLAPRFVLENHIPPSEFIAGSFSAAVNPRLIAQANGILIVEDFGGGVVLFRRP